MPGGRLIDCRAAAAGMLRDTRRDRLVAQRRDKIGAVIALIGAKRDRLWGVGMGLDQGQRRPSLGMAGSRRGHGTDNQTVAASHPDRRATAAGLPAFAHHRVAQCPDAGDVDLHRVAVL